MYISFCLSTPSASGDITHQGFRDTSVQIFWYPTLEDMYYICICLIESINIKHVQEKNIPVYLRLYSIGADYPQLKDFPIVY